MTSLAGRRIGLLTASASRLGGGVFEAVVAQARLIRALGGEAVVLALADAHSNVDADRFAPSSVSHARVIGPAQIGFAPELGNILREAELDLLHLHGIWMYPSRAASNWARATGRPYLISPHGMLDPWITSRGRWKKTLARSGYERASWKTARCFHALTGAEAADIAVETGRADSLVIPNAAPQLATGPLAAFGQNYLYLGRIHPKKNLAALVAAWRDLMANGRLPAEAQLTIAGWGDAVDIAALQSDLADAPASIHFTGPAFGEAKSKLLREARFVIVPSLSEGLPMVVLEAWAAGTPVLMSAACHLPEGFAAGAARDCGTNAASIAQALAAAAALDDAAWMAMAQAAQHLAAGPFGAETIAARWGEGYAALMEPRR